MSLPAELPEIPQRELRNDASRVLREVRAGQGYTITVDGTPVADLVPHRHLNRRVAVPREEVITAFAGLPAGAERWREDLDEAVDDSLYDPYDRAHRRGEFAPRDDR
ncbi:type II toxin-antitoxin system Phd/YefM family antitoxin [Nocardia cyriacigeorgica]|uniref:Type II toxin-antitoxin system prevent-host-death family antitoxin n=1 Tax=Nocardia cyriacigeorgica TaxID=135487 RepID=A0A5R8PCB2_9NOCA|nr:type II toxin-antitoxin system prevent-host-death family antitoxin [Nocardia cyriacigeorgica]TLF82313.1 type II toxin-antitoxin system prevent-host-death family antitoxin [Nocardia cyriacigeorgica]TLG04661.1 type II toxin-antitoxin system prevent-host-death family antitoxin [Nocardia cyriacigeorgica]